MATLPDEIWIQILDYLEPTDLLPIQRVSTRLLKIARDSSLWKAKCFEKAPSATRAFANTDSLTDLLSGLSINSRESQLLTQEGHDGPRMSRRAQAIAKWDCTDNDENIDWYSEYIARQAPLSTEWQHHPEGNEIRGMALFEQGERVLSAMEDGSLRIWDIRTASSGRRIFHEASQSDAGLLFADFTVRSGPSSPPKRKNIGTAVDSAVVDSASAKAYIATEDALNEIDLATMTVLSQNKYAWNITAVSQQADGELPLMVGTSFSLHMHDPRVSLRHQANNTDSKIDIIKETANTVFLPNYSKDWPTPRRGTSSIGLGQRWIRRADPEAWAPVEPGPQTILHRRQDEIIVAGRMPSILFYDKRYFPQLQSVIHSGARLSALTILPRPPHGIPLSSSTAEASLIAAGEYHGRGSLEIYELPYTRPSDRKASYGFSENYMAATPPEDEELIESVRQPTDPVVAVDKTEPYSFKNRQSSSSAKLLSVATQGARIVYSDSEGKLHWLERDGRGLARRWNINSYTFSHTGGAVVGESVARKILSFPSEATSDSGTTRDGDLLFWTGSDLGIVTSKSKWTGHDELVRAFEEQMNLDDSPEGASRRNEAERRRREEEYARTMRRALERQADERRFLARFGRMRP